MKIGQKVICIDDSPGRLDGIKKLTKGETYTILNVNHKDLYVISNDLGWDKNRFKLIDAEFLAVTYILKTVIEHIKA